MSFVPHIGLWDIWSDAARNLEALKDPLLLECLEAADDHRVFDDVSDEKLKSTLSIVNSLLNDPKTKQKGLFLFNSVTNQVNPSRLIGFQDAVISSLHLIVKGLDSTLGSTALANFLPKTQCMSEVNQVVISTIVPKILSYFVEENQGSTALESVENVSLLKMCLQEFHGPCGHFRDKLEKVLSSLFDSENDELIQAVAEALPLLSYSGGGGNAGEKHIQDWNRMLTKFLKTSHSTFLQLYNNGSSTISLEENPFDGEMLTGLKRIAEPQVLLRLVLLKRRLKNLLIAISGYLKYSFPAHKLVPQKGILKLASSLTSSGFHPTVKNVQEKSLTKENAFLAAITPGVHVMALRLLKCLFKCVSTNLFPEGTIVEQILSSEFKWVQEQPRSFEKLRLELYDTCTAWLLLTVGSVTSSKTSAMWIIAIGGDIQIEKDVVELKMTKPKPGKSVKLMNNSSMTLSSGTATQVYVQKNPNLCQAALRTLILLVPALDSDNHKKVYEHILKTSAIILQYQIPPAPYDNPLCRELLYRNLASLSYYPHPRSPISIALTATLLRRGIQDPISLVSSSCANLISQLERLWHPLSSPLLLPGPAPHPVILDNFRGTEYFENSNEQVEGINEDEHPVFQKDTNEGQEMELSGGVSNNQSSVSAPVLLETLLPVVKEKIEETLRALLGNVHHARRETNEINVSDVVNSSSSTVRPRVYETNLKDTSDFQLGNDNSANMQDNDELPIDVSGMNGNSHHPVKEGTYLDGVALNGGSNDNLKRKDVTNIDLEFNAIKKPKSVSPTKPNPVTSELVDGPSVEEMLSSFIDTEPVA